MAGDQQQQMQMETTNEKHGVASVSTCTGGSSSTQTFASSVAFDDRVLTEASSGLATSASTSTTIQSAADFFLDQIAAVVSDEKKLSDNIMDLIPPVEAPVSQVPDVTHDMNAVETTSMGLGMPPPGLMMRALSPPTSLLPDFGDVVPLSLLGDAASAEEDAMATTTAVKREISAGNADGCSGTTQLRGKIDAPSGGKKKQKMESGIADSLASVPASGHQTRQQSSPSSASTAREKIMKEPQSGDLYECVITKRNGGLGLTLACVDDHVQITGLAPDTPAASSGICVGDTLVAVSGLPVRGLQFSTVIGRLKSTSRNSVVLKLRRNPFRQTVVGNAASYRGTKRPGRGSLKGSSSSNSANVLSSKTLALETRLGGHVDNGVNGHVRDASMNGNPIEDVARSGVAAGVPGRDATPPLHLSLKPEPLNSTYFPTDASILTMGTPASRSINSATCLPPSVLAPSSTVPGASHAAWRVSLEEKDRYYAECRALRHELGRAMVAHRLQTRATATFSAQLEAIVRKFEAEVATASTSDESVALRRQLVEAKEAVARLERQVVVHEERDARHAFPEAQRVKWQVVATMRKSVLEVDCKAAVGGQRTLRFEERLDGVRPSTFAVLVGRSRDQVEPSTVELELELTTCKEVLGWNLREVVVQAGASYSVSVTERVRFKYVHVEEVLVVAWTLTVSTS